MLGSLLFGLFTMWCFGLGFFISARLVVRVLRGRVPVPFRIERVAPRAQAPRVRLARPADEPDEVAS